MLSDGKDFCSKCPEDNKRSQKAGFIEDRQKGSHLILIHPRTHARTIVPIHSGKTIKKPLVRGIIDDARLTTEEFLKLP